MEHVNCNLCGRDDAFVRFPSTMPEENGRPADPEHFRCTTLSYGQHYRIVQCRHCGLVYTDPRRPSLSILEDYERVIDDRYLAEREGRLATFERNILPLEGMVSSHNGHRLLDVGAHVGVFVEVASRRGWDACGIEPSRWAVEQAQAQGLDVMRATLRDAELDSESFDAVTMWDVVEHLLDPLADIREVARLLKPGGVFCVHTINVDSLFARAMGKRWPWLVEMHNYFFSPQTLGAMVEKAGLRTETWRVQGRYLHLGYLLSRLSGWNAPLGRFAEGMARALHIDHWLVPVNFGDLFTLYARKPHA
jgi:2-polyprenyl-3-methyl-5-hydroxy-6-metoxy-1,4-benzoquinol methylase